MLIETMNAMKEILEAAITPAVKNRKNRPEFAESVEQSEAKMKAAHGAL